MIYLYQNDKEYDYDLGRRNSALGQKLRWKVTSYKIYEIGERHGYILDYGAFFNPQAISGYERSFETTLSTEYSVLFSHQVTTEFAGYFGTILGIDDLVDALDDLRIGGLQLDGPFDVFAYRNQFQCAGIAERKVAVAVMDGRFVVPDAAEPDADCLIDLVQQSGIKHDDLRNTGGASFNIMDLPAVDEESIAFLQAVGCVV